jgi:hypothetical protein
VSQIPNELAKYEKSVYEIRARLVPPGAGEGSSIKMDMMVTELRIVKDFDSHALPYFRLTIGVSLDDASRVRAAWRQGSVWMEVLRKTVPTDGTATEVDAFQDFIPMSEFRVMETTLDSPPPAVPEAGDSPSASAQAYLGTMELVPVEALGISKAVNGGSYHDATVGEVIAFLTKNNRPPASSYRFWMSPPDNTRRYESLLLPPMSYVEALRYLDRVHGLYSGRLSVFLDVGEGFILSSSSSVRPDPGAAAMVLLEIRPSGLQSMEVSGGSGYDPAQRAFMLRAAGTPVVSAAGPARREVEGSHVRLVRSTQRELVGSNCKGLLPEASDLLFGGSDSRKKDRVLWQGYDNELTMKRLQLEAREDYAPMTAIFDGPDLAAFRPTLPWRSVVQGDSSERPQGELEGYWRLSAVEMVLSQSPASAQPADALVMARLLPASS